MIALAISCEPSLLIADEPTTALDVTVQAQILTLLRSLQEEKGMSRLLISHDLGVIAEMADRMVVMYAGEVVERGDMVETLTRPTHPYTEALLRAQPSQNRKGDPLVTIPGMVPNADAMPSGCRFIRAAATSSTVARSNTPCSTKYLRNRRAVCGPRMELEGVASPSLLNEGPRREPESRGERETILQVQNLRKQFALRSTKVFGRKAQLTAVDDASFTLRAGETIGLVGESGAGKSTVGRLILGLVRPTSGSIEFRGQQITRGFGRRRDLRRDVHVCFRIRTASLDPMMTIEQTLSEPLEVHLKLDQAAPRQSARAARTGRPLPRTTQTAIRMPCPVVSGNASQSPEHLR